MPRTKGAVGLLQRSIAGTVRPVQTAYRNGRVLVRDTNRIARVLAHGKSLRAVQDNTRKIKPTDVLLVCCLRNELFRMSFFLDYYRELGVDHFLIVDNDSTDDFLKWVSQFGDCSVWHTKASYLESKFGMQWCNYLLRRYGTGHLCVTVDPDEFLVYPRCDCRSLPDLGLFLKDDKRSCMHVLMLDCYSDGPLDEAIYRSGDDPFAVCPFFDRDGYIQRLVPSIRSTWVQGGPRLRVYNRATPGLAPAVNKVPVVWWKSNFTYESSMHDLIPTRLNMPHTPGEVSLTGCLFHFKFVATLADKAREEAERKQHYAGGREYARYREAPNIVLYSEGISVRYESPEQLVSLGLMNGGLWV
jgi:Glycosyl transferase family 2